MEALSLLKFWRTAGKSYSAATTTTTTISAGATVKTLLQTQDNDTDDEDEDSFFDLEFTSPDFDETEPTRPKEFQIKTSEDSHNNNTDPIFDFIKSPNDCFKGRIVPVDSNSKPQSPIPSLRSGTKLRVLMLGFKKPKMASPNQKSPAKEQSKRFAAKCEVEEVPISSLLRGDECLRAKLTKQSSEEEAFSRDALQRYLKVIKPLCVWVSKRYGGEKTKFSDQSSIATPTASPATATLCSPRKQAEERRPAAALRMVCKHLGKSRSASAAVRIMPSPARRDDSLLEQHDGIQSAILHCKRSFSSSSREFSIYSRTASDIFLEKTINPPRKSTEEAKRSSI